MTCIQYAIGRLRGGRGRFAVPDPVFALSFGGGFRAAFDRERWSAFAAHVQVLTQSFLALAERGDRTAQVRVGSAGIGAIDFVLKYFAERLQVSVAGTAGEKWQRIRDNLGTWRNAPLRLLSYLAELVLRWRNSSAHPASRVGQGSPSRGESISMLCRLADFVHWLDASVSSDHA
jgi:hypothetical protein